ncbi:class I SAM-dependent methyltransferase [Pedobacter sp. B4-66]|uniref:class I SAM-dependent methyltransferase n=1 Tax=Pedobacter sp. B4-66 TaxID=2817280 RepID=UPI0024E266D4|nr:class I SAM-dependent methyltransferase [Pedobacter sp. B4-66]
MLGKQLEEMWKFMGCTSFTVVEYGAGTGQLCQAILNYLKANKKMYTLLRYCIIEKSQAMQQLARLHLPDQVEWYQDITEIGQIQGCILSNELVDNFAVHRVVMKKILMEVYVDYENGYAEQLKPAKSALRAYLSELNIKLPRGYATEINLEALDWITSIASTLKSGYIITIDYGYKGHRIYNANQDGGTLICYHQHAVNDSFYTHIGEQDITSHVNFTALSHWGAKNGLKESGFTDQGYFLTCLGFREYLLNVLATEEDIVQAAKQATFLNHILLVDMGSKYKVLIQEKGVQSNPLSGLANCPAV